MAEFQKSLIRFIYVALVVAVVLAAWGIMRPSYAPTTGASPLGPGFRDSRGVTASGTCVVRTKPELVEVSFGVKQSSKTARAAKDYVKATGRKIIQVLRDGGVAAKDIQTQNFSLQSDWHSGQGWQVKNWSAHESLRVRIRNIDKVADLIDSAVKAGANRVGALQYTVDNLNEIRSRGRAKAAAVARKKAAELASALDGKLGRLVACDERYPGEGGYYGYDGYDGGYYGGRYTYAANAQVTIPSAPTDSGGAEEVTIQPGEMVTTVVVTATYEVL